MSRGISSKTTENLETVTRRSLGSLLERCGCLGPGPTSDDPGIPTGPTIDIERNQTRLRHENSGPWDPGRRQRYLNPHDGSDGTFPFDYSHYPERRSVRVGVSGVVRCDDRYDLLGPRTGPVVGPTPYDNATGRRPLVRGPLSLFVCSLNRRSRTSEYPLTVRGPGGDTSRFTTGPPPWSETPVSPPSYVETPPMSLDLVHDPLSFR